MNNKKFSSLYSWPVIIVALCVFWPVGLFLALRRFSVDKTAMMKTSGKGLKILGIVLIVLGIFGIIGSLDPLSVANIIIFLFFFIGGGLVLVNKSKKIQAEGDTIKRYLAIIVNNNIKQLDAIAATMGKQYDVVRTDVQKMIDKGFLKNAYINEGTREIVMTVNNNTDNTFFQAQSNVAAAEVEVRVVACPCCGANNTVSGAVGECEYCGTPLQ